MHYTDFIAVLCDANKKPLRELDSQRLDNGRKTKVFMPFDTEYSIMIKNNSNGRIKLNIDIDGSNVTNNGLIMSANTVDYIERFVDIAKRFKFVKSTDEKVADPSNLENGVIKIRILKECIPAISLNNYQHFPNNDGWYNNQPYCGLNDRNIGYCSNMNAVGDNMMGSLTTSSLYSSSMESGATVEGGNSNQSFGMTTWGGDTGIETVFTFHLFGTSDSEIQKKLDTYLKLKAELGI